MTLSGRVRDECELWSRNYYELVVTPRLKPYSLPYGSVERVPWNFWATVRECLIGGGVGSSYEGPYREHQIQNVAHVDAGMEILTRCTAFTDAVAGGLILDQYLLACLINSAFYHPGGMRGGGQDGVYQAHREDLRHRLSPQYRTAPLVADLALLGRYPLAFMDYGGIRFLLDQFRENLELIRVEPYQLACIYGVAGDF